MPLVGNLDHRHMTRIERQREDAQGAGHNSRSLAKNPRRFA